MENIWILNHYASIGGRHYKFAENLIKQGYKVKIFRASTVHNTNKNLIVDSSRYLYEKIMGRLLVSPDMWLRPEYWPELSILLNNISKKICKSDQDIARNSSVMNNTFNSKSEI